MSNHARFWIVFWMSNHPGWIQQEHLSTWWWRTPAAKWSWRAERWTGWSQNWTQSSSQLLPKIISKLLPKIISQLLPMIISQLLPKLLSPLLPKVTSCMQAPRSFGLQVMKKIHFFRITSPSLSWRNLIVLTCAVIPVPPLPPKIPCLWTKLVDWWVSYISILSTSWVNMRLHIWRKEIMKPSFAQPKAHVEHWGRNE